MGNDEIMGLNLPTGIPFVYKLDENMKPIESMKVIVANIMIFLQCKCKYFFRKLKNNFFFQFLGDEETVKKAMEAVAAQGKAKK